MKVVQFDFQGYTMQDLLRGRDALMMLIDAGFDEYWLTLPEKLSRIEAELERRQENAIMM